MNPTVRYGSRGEHVVKLQEGLNQLPSALARLTTDGIYGQKSIARVREFQGKNGLVPDGIVGPNTWGVFLQLVAQIVAKLPAAPPTPTTAMFALMRPQVIGFARGFVGRVDFSVMVNGRPKGIDLIKNIFAKAANTPLTDDNFRKGDGTWTWVPIVGGKPKSWCGIFCVHCYRLAGFSSVTWSLNGGPVGPIKMAQFSTHFVDQVQTADIGVVATQEHHFLIVGTEPGKKAPRIHSIEGNTTWGRIVERPIPHPNGHQFFKDNFNYYRVQ